jgi:hypothetical protein
MMRERIRELNIPLWARNRALHYLAGNYKLSDELGQQLTQSRLGLQYRPMRLSGGAG